jgi:hypothetical protein
MRRVGRSARPAGATCAWKKRREAQERATALWTLDRSPVGAGPVVQRTDDRAAGKQREVPPSEVDVLSLSLNLLLYCRYMYFLHKCKSCPVHA